MVGNCNLSYCNEHNTPEKRTLWVMVPIDSSSFKMVPTRRIMTPFIDYQNIFLVSIDGREKQTNLL